MGWTRIVCQAPSRIQVFFFLKKITVEQKHGAVGDDKQLIFFTRPWYIYATLSYLPKHDKVLRKKLLKFQQLQKWSSNFIQICLNKSSTVDSRTVSDYWSSSVQCRYWGQASSTNELYQARKRLVYCAWPLFVKGRDSETLQASIYDVFFILHGLCLIVADQLAKMESRKTFCDFLSCPNPIISFTDFWLTCVFGAFHFSYTLHSQMSAACAQGGCEIVLGGRIYMLHPVAGRYPIAVILPIAVVLYNIWWSFCKVSTIPYSCQFTYI